MRKGVMAACVLATSLGLLTAGCGDKHKAVPSSGGLAQPTSPGPEQSPPESPGAPESSPPAATESPGATVSPAPGPVTINAKDTSVGKILVDDKGMTLYLFDKDKDGKSSCTGECEKQWPPVVTTEKATAGQGVDASKLGTTDRPDGTKQVTYNNHPLYHYVKDTKPGDMNGQGAQAFDGKWYVVDATKGDKIEKK
ncbi:COG4315 family predicted lipoprotein [Actinoallomurus acaciae]|uniref:Lipoprotein with Yx(FWY)xxD motif n=1 Tax=Actinoallomurus acaciae TaxID=502577 RepID=A0ABV5Z1W2_9ACTN